MEFTRILKNGSRGDDVAYMQQCLIKLNYDCGKTGADGIFGNNTEKAVKNYQSSHVDIYSQQLDVDGKIGEKTWGAIERDIYGEDQPSDNVDEQPEVSFTRTLKKGMSGDDVFYMKQLLFSLGYYNSNVDKITHNRFANDTYNAVINFQKKNNLSQTGEINEGTWNLICDEGKDIIIDNSVKFTRNLKKGMSGDDVLYIKNKLFSLKYYSSSITAITHNAFGQDTYNAVIDYQQYNNLDVDGVVGQDTWNSIVNNSTPKKEQEYNNPVDLSSYTNISKSKRTAIEKDLAKVNDTRQKIVLEILKYAYDHDAGGEVKGLYMIGGNLYNTNLKLNIPTVNKIESEAKRKPDYYDNGRKEWMIQQIKRNPNLPASDCSGMEVGYMRKFKIVASNYDRTADQLCSDSYSTAVSKDALIPADWVGKSGHIGTYVGGGYVVEFVGGEYGCQLTKLTSRKAYSFTKKRLANLSSWTKYRRPKAYK